MFFSSIVINNKSIKKSY